MINNKADKGNLSLQIKEAALRSKEKEKLKTGI